MAEREKVIRGLELCAYDPDPGQELKEIRSCPECPYYRAGCSPQLIRDTLALLKEQEPRVLTTEELTQIKPWSVYWGEGLNVRNMWTMAFTAEAIQNLDEGYLKDSYGRAYELDLYNKDVMGWRIWTARPTEEQRKAVAWNV